MKEFSILCIFTPTGKTYTFRDVEVVTDNETVIVFNYKAMSDDLIKTATFYKSSICGISTTTEK